jgi:CheY-like chemotaxis protein
MDQEQDERSPEVVSELNNLIQIISGTSSLIENIWEGSEGSEKYFAMLRASIERAEQMTAQLVAQAGGAEGKILLHPELQKMAESITEPPPAPRQPVILVVDDEPMALGLLRRILTEAGYHVVSAQSGFECLDLFRRGPASYDLVLLDYAMPFMDGAETFERLRQMSSNVAVVFTTGFITTECLDRLMADGLSGFVRKPFSPADILSTVASVLKRTGHANLGSDGIAAAI